MDDQIKELTPEMKRRLEEKMEEEGIPPELVTVPEGDTTEPIEIGAGRRVKYSDFRQGDIVIIYGCRFKVRKITKKDMILRPCGRGK